MPEKKLGLVQVYTGDGKGKTTAALGLALRAVGHGLRVQVIQFVKGGTHTGEYAVAGKLLKKLKIKQFGRPCPYSDKMQAGKIDCGNCRYCFSIDGEDKSKTEKAMRYTHKVLEAGRCDILILDEINCAVSMGLVGVDEILGLIKNKPDHIELVLTGRGAHPKIVKAADLVTEMKPLKHPLKKGIFVRRGIEY